MNVYNMLEPILKDILGVINPLREDWVMRTKIIEQLQEVADSVDSLRGATVEAYGSVVSNHFTRWGDLDVAILLHNGSYISSAGKKRKQNLLAEFLQALRQRGGWRKLQFIPNARVPILKFEGGHQNISCDISIDNIQGLMKSKFLLWINEIDWRFRDMVLLVKEWAKAHNINNPKAGSLNSYSLSLMVIFHFQTCVPAILPPLKDIYPRNAVDDLRGVRADAERQIGEICAANIAKYRADRRRAVNRSSLAELFVSFLAKFSDLSLKAGELGICPFTGRWEDITSNMRWLPRTYSLFIEDPFEQPENSARAVSAGNLIRISEAFQTTYRQLTSGNINSASLLGLLVKPRVSYFVTGTPKRDPVYPAGNNVRSHPGVSRAVHTPPPAGNNVRTHPRVSRAVHTPPPSSSVQHKFQNMKLEDHPKSFTQRKGYPPNNSGKQKLGAHPNQSTERKQVQQMWRLKSGT